MTLRQNTIYLIVYQIKYFACLIFIVSCGFTVEIPQFAVVENFPMDIFVFNKTIQLNASVKYVFRL